MRRGLFITALLLSAGLAVWLFRHLLRPSLLPPKPRTVEQVLNVLGPSVEHRLKPAFKNAHVPFPPSEIALLAFKVEMRIDLYAEDPSGTLCFILSWPILAASGTAGPKQREGDRQVPEGFYRIELLNPNSRYHLSLRVNYPNAADIARAKEDGRELSDLGGDIMIHGGAASIGCLAVGDPAIEDLFVLAARVGLDNIRLIISPCDFRSSSTLPPQACGAPPDLYMRLQNELMKFAPAENVAPH